MPGTYDVPLDGRKEQIRLLELHPATSQDAPINCVPKVVSLSDKPIYIALSYTWGDPADKCAIEFDDDVDFRIPKNLDGFLRQIRSCDSAKVIWADAISINQAPKAVEKNNQVALMDKIYSQATETLIWLGGAADDSDLAMNAIHRLHIDDVWNITADTFSDQELVAIVALQARGWWSRTWVIQEILLSPNPVILCGSKTASVEAFIHLDDVRRGYHRPTRKYIDNAEQPSRFELTQNKFSVILTDYPEDKELIKAGQSNLSTWTKVTDYFYATDPRDKIYGLLGIGKQQERSDLLPILPDYSESVTVADVYARATARFILEYQLLLPLQFNVDDVDPDLHLPSWCPDYSNRPDREKAGYRGFWLGPTTPGGFFASGPDMKVSDGVEKLFPQSTSSDRHKKVIHLTGWIIDTVVYASENPYLPPYSGSNGVERARNVRQRAEQTRTNVLIWEQEARRRLSTQSPYQPKSVDDVFWRTLMADRDFRWDLVPDSYKRYFDIWLGRSPLPPLLPGSGDPETEDELEERRRIHVKPFTDSAITRTHARSFIITASGYMGLASKKTRVGDTVVVCKGSCVPFVLRSHKDVAEWTFLGESFIMGIMEGQSVGNHQHTSFVIV
ncbi:Heterokaryon incompatibility protein 6, OR allele [Colletotrichum aenigma]|uniref:Heterokaryon incompatibility protein 6, OR allele n=1 Tax=Colletotrichum aenigma TaxID=1215731 RepID=UPI0018726216|nr:Heterokaryon incompatibility protein 6, OR allele [Colletotrichum aenigma]KAF5523167.1 Heterokaryon incompatibility protein 6, OR allele [Colletotrichum aenigma]